MTILLIFELLTLLSPKTPNKSSTQIKSLHYLASQNRAQLAYPICHYAQVAHPPLAFNYIQHYLDPTFIQNQIVFLWQDC